jgi:hypothetical protein
MSYRLEDQPEWAGPLSEDAEPGQSRPPAVSYPGPARPLRDPAAEAIERTIEAERQADLFKSAPPDATEIS